MLDAKKVIGFNNLSENNQKLFTAFLSNFYHAWGLEVRDTIKPLKISYMNDIEGKYLRFDYEIYDRKEWLHVTTEKNWY